MSWLRWSMLQLQRGDLLEMLQSYRNLDVSSLASLRESGEGSRIQVSHETVDRPAYAIPDAEMKIGDGSYHLPTHHRLVDDADKPVVASLSSEHGWLYMSEKTFHIRWAIVDLFECVDAMRRLGKASCVLSGTPGTGKTSMTNYCLIRWLSDPSVTEIVVHSLVTYSCLHIQKNAQANESNGAPNDSSALTVHSIPMTAVHEELAKISERHKGDGPVQKAIYICDCGTRVGAPFVVPIFTVVTASPNESHYADILKQMNTAGKFYLPLWTLGEMLAARNLMYDAKVAAGAERRGVPSVEEVKRRYEEFHGVFRHTLSPQSSTVWRKQQDQSLKQVTWSELHSIVDGTMSAHWPRHLIICVSEAPYQDIQVEAVSRRMYGRIARSLLKHQRESTINQIHTGSWGTASSFFGKIWEGLVIDTLCGGSLHCVTRVVATNPDQCISDDTAAVTSTWMQRKLVSPSVCLTEATNALTIEVCARWDIPNSGVPPTSGWDTVEVPTLRRALLLVPTASNFPACDAILCCAEPTLVHAEARPAQPADEACAGTKPEETTALLTAQAKKKAIYLLQMTVGLNHPVSPRAYQRLETMVRAWQDVPKNKAWRDASLFFIFVIPNSQSHHWTRIQAWKSSASKTEAATAPATATDASAIVTTSGSRAAKRKRRSHAPAAATATAADASAITTTSASQAAKRQQRSHAPAQFVMFLGSENNMMPRSNESSPNPVRQPAQAAEREQDVSSRSLAAYFELEADVGANTNQAEGELPEEASPDVASTRTMA